MTRACTAARLAGAVLVVTLAGCAAPPAPRETFFRLEAPAPAQHFATPPLPGVLEVDRVETEGVLSERALAFENGPDSLQRYTYEFWSDPPGARMQDVLAHTLRQVGAAATVVTPDLRVPPDWILRAKLTRFEQIPAAGNVVIGLEVAIIGANDGRLVLQQDYQAEAPTHDESATAAALALGTATSKVLTRLVADLGHLPPLSVRRP